GVTVIEEWQDAADDSDPHRLLLVDDAHLLEVQRLQELRRLVEARRCRLAVTYRPWPRPAALVELTDALKRHGPPLILGPFNEAQTAAYLTAAIGAEATPARARFVHTQTGGVPRHVERLARSFEGQWDRVPTSALLPFSADLDELGIDGQRLLLAAVGGVELPVDVLGILLSREPREVGELLAKVRATGLLGQDNGLTPIVRQAVASLSSAAYREGVWQRLAELHLQRGGAALPLARSLHSTGIRGGYLAMAFEAAANEALADEPALAAELFAAAAAGGRPTTARHAQAAALSGDLDSALRLSDRLVANEDSPDRAEGATVGATALAHRGQLGRSAELYRWSGTASSAAFAAIAAAATGQADELERFLDQPPSGRAPTLLASASVLMGRGVRETLTGQPTAALSAFVQASALLEPAGQTVLLPDSPAALAALVALHSGEFDIGESVLDDAVASGLGAALMSSRHRLLQAWIPMVRGKTAAAAEYLAAATSEARQLESRDLLFATALEVGIARRSSDLPGLQRSWGRAREAIVRHPVDLFTLLPLGEFAIAAARLGELNRLQMHLREARLLLDRLGNPALWATPWHWSALHAAIIMEEPTVADEHVAALVAARQTRFGSAVAAAAESWLEILRGVVDPARVETAARGLHHIGMSWDGARLAGQAAIRTSDRKAMTALLDCARMLQGRPAQTGHVNDAITVPNESRLSDREQEVAELVLGGLTYKQIADQLFISAKTVEHHVARMRQRLNCASRSELLAKLRSMAAPRSSAEQPRVPWPRRPTP
ncbi:MAG TPA: helix-turn-helix transcriptional regulator, partial [Micromonosporaceae bacterium]|nr:helix-turn-helix transcriptional regulator [Micromonosporaceae bacterium]